MATSEAATSKTAKREETRSGRAKTVLPKKPKKRSQKEIDEDDGEPLADTVAKWFEDGSKTMIHIGGHRGGTADGQLEGAKEVMRLDKVRGVWTKFIDLPASLVNHCVYQLKDDIFIVGGLQVTRKDKLSEEIVGSPLNGFWLYDPVQRDFELLPTLGRPRHSCAVASIFGAMYCVGGAVDHKKPTDIVEIYDRHVKQWKYGPSLPSSRCSLSAVAYEDRIYVCGGVLDPVTTPIGFVNMTDEFLCMSLHEGVWQQLKPLPEKRCMGQLVDVEGLFYYIGGAATSEYRGTVVPCSEVFKYDPPANKWSLLCHLARARHSFAVTKSGNNIFLIGGLSQGAAIRSVECLDLLNGISMPIACPLPAPRYSGGAAIVDY